MRRGARLLPWTLMFLALGAHGAVEIPPAYAATAEAYGVPVHAYYAIALQESNRRVPGHGVKPWPWTLNIAGRPAYFASREAAYTALLDALKQTQRIDVGPMQIHWKAHKRLLGTPWAALDPLFNLRVGAYLLRDCIERRSTLRSAIGCYHAPNNATAAQRYISQVVPRIQRLVEAAT